MYKIILVVLVFVTSCTVGPNYNEPDVYEDMQIAQALKLNNTNL